MVRNPSCAVRLALGQFFMLSGETFKRRPVFGENTGGQFANWECTKKARRIHCLRDNYKVWQELRVGLRILAFPCNQFAGQEPGKNEEIACFLADRKVKFDLFEKIDVNGDNASPLWKFLKHKQGGTLGKFVKWNFTKFIIDKDGVPVERHAANVDPSDLIKSLEKYW